MPPGTTETRHVKVSFDTSGNRELQQAVKELGLMNKNVKSLTGSVGFLKNAFVGYIGSLGIREVVAISDKMQTLNNRLKILTGSEEGAGYAMGQIAKIANDTNQSLTDTAQIYTRIGTALREVGASTDAILSITKTLINTFRLSGSVGSELTATITQLSQSFASGTLRGDELRSVMEQNAVVAGLLRQRFGPDIFEKAKKGMITTVEFLELLRDNAKTLNEEAKKLTPTIGETLTKAFNKAQIAIFEFSEELEIPAKFATFVDFITDNLDILGASMVAFAITQAPAMLKAIAALEFALTGFIASNPLLATLAALAIASVALIRNFKELKEATYDLQLAFASGDGYSNAKLGLIDDTSLKKTKSQLEELEEIKKKVRDNRNAGQVYTVVDPRTDEEKQKFEVDELIKKYKEMFKQEGKLQKIKEMLAALNNEYLNGSISIQEYNKKIIDFELTKLNREFQEGKINLGKFNEEMTEIANKRLTKAFNEGIISVQQFNEAISQNNIDDLNNKLAAGTINLKEFDIELAKISEKFDGNAAFRAGVQGYIDSIGTTSQQVASAIQNTFVSLETFLNDFIKKGKFNFKGFAQAILDDLQKIIIRASIVQPLAQGLLSAITPAASGVNAAQGASYTYGTPAAKGMAFDTGGVRKFAKGGVVTGPTNFGMKSGMGLMGESGPEAILPLERGRNGSLGVTATVTPVTVNIINQTGSQVEQKETTGANGEKTIDILITSRVREGVAAGTFDRVFKQSFGIERKGS